MYEIRSQRLCTAPWGQYHRIALYIRPTSNTSRSGTELQQTPILWKQSEYERIISIRSVRNINTHVAMILVAHVNQCLASRTRARYITHWTWLLSGVMTCSQFICTLAVPSTHAKCISVYSTPMHLCGPLPNTRKFLGLLHAEPSGSSHLSGMNFVGSGNTSAS